MPRLFDHRKHVSSPLGRLVTRAVVGVLASVALVGGSLLPASPASMQGEQVLAHREDGERVGSTGKRKAPITVLFRTGHVAAEPTIAFSDEGDIFFAAANLGSDQGVDVLRSENGRRWEVASPRLGPADAHPITMDPYIYVDPETSRLFSVDLTVACSLLSFSDDNGESWTTNPLGCGRPVNDHQTLFAGPPSTSTTLGYPSVVYYCFNDVATSSCTKSLDGGITFVTTGEPAFTPADWSGSGCRSLHGQGVTDQKGNVYLPKAHCGQPWLAISKDEGKTWQRVQVATNGVPNTAAPSDPSVAVDQQGNVYYVWIAANRLPYLSISRSQGKTWTKPVMIGAPGVKEANLVTIAAGAEGRIAVAYVGSENSPYQKCNPEAECDRPYSRVTWNGYITVSSSTLERTPLFFSGAVNPEENPFVTGRCGPGRCYPLWDFIDVQIDPRGVPWAAFVDGDEEGSVNGEGVLGVVQGGPRLR